MNNNECPICKRENAQVEKIPGSNTYEIKCKRCGEFVIVDKHLIIRGKGQLGTDDERLLPYLSAHTRQATESGVRSEILEDSWRDLAQAHTTTSISQKVTKLLELVAARSSYPGCRVIVDAGLDCPLLDAASDDEVNYLLSHLQDRDYIQGKSAPFYTLTVKGWERLEPPAGAGIPGRCFIAMSFDPSLKDAYDAGVYLAVKEDCKLDPIRIDRIHHNEKICDKILAEIRRAQFVIADFTYHRGGVYFEAGFAMGLGRPVIWTCREDDLVNTHFDTRQYNHIVWTTTPDLRTKLVDRIRATILK